MTGGLTGVSIRFWILVSVELLWTLSCDDRCLDSVMTETDASAPIRKNIIHHTTLFLFSFFIFFYHSSCPKDQFTVLIFKFGTQDFTDKGLLNIRLILTGLSLWFCLQNCF